MMEATIGILYGSNSTSWFKLFCTHIKSDQSQSILALNFSIFLDFISIFWRYSFEFCVICWMSWRGDAEPFATRESIQWIHLRSVPKKMDFFVFSSGRIRKLDSVDSEFIGSYIKDHLMNSIYPEHTVVLTGHSEGSGCNITTYFPSEGSLVHSEIFSNL